MDTNITLEWLEKRGACIDAKMWLREKCDGDVARGWEICHCGDWMLWLIDALYWPGILTEEILKARFIMEVNLADGKTTWDILQIPEVKQCVLVLNDYISGKANEKQYLESLDRAEVEYNSTPEKYVINACAEYAPISPYAIDVLDYGLQGYPGQENKIRVLSEAAGIIRELFPTLEDLTEKA